MNTPIHPIFSKLNLKIEHSLDKNEKNIPLDHPIYNDVRRMIDEYEDKWFLYKYFKEMEEKQIGNKLEEYNNLLLLKKIDDEANITNKVRELFRELHGKEYKNKNIIRKFFTDEVPERFPDLPPQAISAFNGNPRMRKIDIKKEIGKVKPDVEKYVKYSFAEYIKEKYHPEQNEFVKLELQADADNIFNKIEEIKSGYFDIHLNTRPEKYTLKLNTYNKKESIKLECCKILEKHYGLIYNPKNGIHYISDGQGKYIEFSKKNNHLIYKPLRDQFIGQYYDSDKDKNVKEPIIWSKPKFYKLADDYSVMESEAEKNLIGLKNCYYNIKDQIIYELDPRYPRLPMKKCRVNFIYDKDLNDHGGALQEIFNECFTKETAETIFKYFGRALFEEGYTFTQDIMFFLGKGGVGKTTFINALSKIFNKVTQMSADKLNPRNKFAFSGLPGADFVVMDEITNAQEGFTEKLKEMTGGSDSISCEQKNKNPFDLPSEAVPRMIGIGNNLPEFIYDKFTGDGVIRRFCIIFLKRSILEAKKMTKEVNGKIYPITNKGTIIKDGKINKDGDLEGFLYDDKLNPIISQKEHLTGIQGRNYFEIDELTEQGCLEWFMQQIILHYKPTNKYLLDKNTAKEHALMAYLPEKWAAMRWVEPIYDDQGNLDKNEFVTATDLLNKLREDVDKHMLERVINNRLDPELEDLIYSTFNIPRKESITGYGEDSENSYEKFFYGIKILDEPKPINYDLL